MLFVFSALIGAAALNLLLVLNGRGSFPHALLVYGAAFHLALPAVLVGAVFTGFGKTGSPARNLGFTLLTIGFILGSSIVSLPLGAEVNSKDIVAAKRFCDALAPRLQSFKESHGKYPSEITDLGEVDTPPHLLRDGRYYWSDGKQFNLSFSDPAGMMNGWCLESTTMEWRKWD